MTEKKENQNHPKTAAREFDWVQAIAGLKGGLLGILVSIPVFSWWWYMLSGFEDSMRLSFIRTIVGYLIVFGFFQFGSSLAKRPFRKPKGQS